MSELLILTRPELAAGFQLAGVTAVAAVDAAAAAAQIERWLDGGETGLLAIDQGLLDELSPAVRARLAAAPGLPHLALPDGRPVPAVDHTRQRLTELLRQAIGFRITLRPSA